MQLVRHAFHPVLVQPRTSYDGRRSLALVAAVVLEAQLYGSSAVGEVEELADDVREGQLHVVVEDCGICSASSGRV